MFLKKRSTYHGNCRNRLPLRCPRSDHPRLPSHLWPPEDPAPAFLRLPQTAEAEEQRHFLLPVSRFSTSKGVGRKEKFTSSDRPEDSRRKSNVNSGGPPSPMEYTVRPFKSSRVSICGSVVSMYRSPRFPILMTLIFLSYHHCYIKWPPHWTEL